jgi:hypothetical protein
MKTETRTDFVGPYTAYIYDDGHIETDPPGRPMSQEDAQRDRKRQIALTRARRILEIERAKYGVGVAAPPEVVRQKAATLAGRLVAEEYHRTMAVFGQLPDTIASPAGLNQMLSDTVDLGGDISPDFMPQRPAEVQQTGVREPTFALEVE